MATLETTTFTDGLEKINYFCARCACIAQVATSDLKAATIDCEIVCPNCGWTMGFEQLSSAWIANRRKKLLEEALCKEEEGRAHEH